MCYFLLIYCRVHIEKYNDWVGDLNGRVNLSIEDKELSLFYIYSYIFCVDFSLRMIFKQIYLTHILPLQVRVDLWVMVMKMYFPDLLKWNLTVRCSLVS